MKLLEKLYNQKIITSIYVLLPIIEIITSYMITNMEITVTPGIIYKTLFLLYGVSYLILVDKKYRKTNCIMLGLFGVMMILHTVITIESFTIAAIFVKISQSLKYLCFPIVLWFLYRYIQNGNKLDIKTIMICAIIYGGTMIIGWITGTYMPTYNTRPDAGHSGWIYSGNELSSILSMFYPIIIYYTARYKNKLGIMALFLTTYGLLAIGTKTAFLALIISILAFLIFGIIKFKKQIGKNLVFIMSILVITIMGVFTYFPTLTEIAERVNIAKSEVEETISKENQQSEIVDNFVFNGRTQFLDIQQKKFDQVSIPQKMFGLNGEDKPANENKEYKLIERDFHDLIITYGVIPTILYFIPFAIIGVSFALRFFKNFKKEFNTYNFSLGVSIMMTLGVAYIVGHVLLVPTVTIFLCFVLAKLHDESEVIDE